MSENANEVQAPESKGESVTMTDGRVVVFSAKAKMLKDVLIDGAAITVRFDFRNGETRSWTIPDQMLAQCAGHGASAKLGDMIAGVKEVDDCVLEIEEGIAQLNRGEWNSKREAGGMSGTSVLLQALVKLTGQSVEQVKEGLKTLSAKEKAILRNSAQLKPIVDEIEAAKAAKAGPVDTGALLAKFGVSQPA